MAPPAPKRHRSAPPTRAASWQRKAARKALFSRLGAIALVALGVVYVGTLFPGQWGDLARSLWAQLTGWIPPLLGR